MPANRRVSGIALPGCGILAAASLLFTGSPPATASEPVVVTAERPDAGYSLRIVKYGDLQLLTANGEKVLLNRVRRAVREVCPWETSSATDYLTYDCRDFAWKGARPQMAAAVERARSGDQLVTATMAIRIVGH